MADGVWRRDDGPWTMDHDRGGGRVVLTRGRGLWSVVYGLWSVVYGLWSVVCGPWPALRMHGAGRTCVKPCGVLMLGGRCASLAPDLSCWM